MNQRFLVLALLLSPQINWADEPGKLDWQTRAGEQARILSEVQWTPVADTIPNRRGGFFEKGKQYTGVPYSSVRSTSGQVRRGGVAPTQN